MPRPSRLPKLGNPSRSRGTPRKTSRTWWTWLPRRPSSRRVAPGTSASVTALTVAVVGVVAHRESRLGRVARAEIGGAQALHHSPQVLPWLMPRLARQPGQTSMVLHSGLYETHTGRSLLYVQGEA